MDVSYSTEYVHQLQSSEVGSVPMAGIARVRLPRPITLRDPLWGGAAAGRHEADGSFLIAESGAGLVGFALLLDDPARNISALSMLAVVTHARRQGIGTQLMTVCLTNARDRGRRAIAVTLQARNDPGVRFLESAGFVWTGYDAQYFNANDVAVFFAYRLRVTGTGG